MKDLFALKNENPRKNIVLSQQFDINFLYELFELADFMKENRYNVSHILKNKIVAMLFYESSTRTRFSFEAAVNYLGGKCITTENASEFSSVSKGETIEDTILMLNNYVDIIVMRHFEDDSSKRAVVVSKVPLINAGSGKSQHPTQALLDIYTIYSEIGRLENLNIAIVGDLLRGRTCDSLVYLLSKFKGNKFYFISPENSKAKKSLKKYLIENDNEFIESENLNNILSKIDVCYMTRIQKERFSSSEEYEKVKGKYILNEFNVENMKDDAIIMHPLPRVDEISSKIDSNKRSKYFIQAQNGLYIRMGLLKILIENSDNNLK